MTKEIKLNKKRAIEICQIVLEAFENKRKLFFQSNIEERMLPEKQLISVVPKEKQPTWLFFSCIGDKLTNSTKYYKEFREFHLSFPNFFNYENIIDEKNLEKNLREKFIPKVKIAIQEEFIRYTISSAKKLCSEFKGNPLNIINEDYKNPVENLKKFLGYGKGEATLYLLFLDRYNLKEIKGLGPKIDRHFIRISDGCGVIKIEDGIRYEKTVDPLSKLYTEICNEKNLKATYLDPAIWIIGHEICPTKNLTDCVMYCPLDEYCNKNLPTINREDARLYHLPSKKQRNKNQLVFSLFN